MLYIVSAPSGTGKTTLVKKLAEKYPSDIKLSISHTTRLKRKLESEGVDYYFIAKNNFNTMIEKNQFLEYAAIYGEYYGTSYQEIEDGLTANKKIILEIDYQGARTIREKFKNNNIKNYNYLSTFILPPSKKVLKNRLYSRHQNDSNTADFRFLQACEEVKYYTEFDNVIINDDLSHALEQLENIIFNNNKIFNQQNINKILKDFDLNR